MSQHLYSAPQSSLVFSCLLSMCLCACTGTETDSDAGGRTSQPDSGQNPMDAGANTQSGAEEKEEQRIASSLALAENIQEARLLDYMQTLVDFGTRYTFSDGDDDARAYLKSLFEGWGYLVEEDTFDVQGEAATNLIIKIEGAVNPEQIVVFSAHYDSTSEIPLVLAPGADDNASGVAALLETAVLLDSVAFEKSIWFVLTAAEEQGSLGSASLAQQWSDSNLQVEAVMAPDMIGYWPRGDNDEMDILGNESSEHLAEDMALFAEELGVSHRIWIRHDYCYGDDHTNYQENGFPAISPMDCVEAHNVSASGEETPHYHISTDSMDTIHMGFTTRVTEVLVATFAYWATPVQ